MSECSAHFIVGVSCQEKLLLCVCHRVCPAKQPTAPTQEDLGGDRQVRAGYVTNILRSAVLANYEGELPKYQCGPFLFTSIETNQ